MTVLEGVREALRILNLVEIKGESNIVAMGRVLELIKGIEDFIVRSDGVHDGTEE